MKLTTARTLVLALFGSALGYPFDELPLSPYVKADLAKRDPSTYKVFETSGSPRSSHLQARAAPNGLDGVQTNCKTDKCVAWSFDDASVLSENNGPYEYNKEAVDTAVANNIGITFFVNVNNFECIYEQKNVERIKYAYSMGAQICSHTATHPHLNDLTKEQIDRQIQLVEDALYKIQGIVPRCLRPPYGELNEENAQYIQDRWGLAILNWSLDTRDSLGASVNESLEILQNNIAYPQMVSILSHETKQTTVQELFPQAINLIKGKGYASSDFKTAAEAYQFSPYKVVGQPQERDETWTCDGIVPGQP